MSEKDGGPAFPQPIANAGAGSGIVTADECRAGGSEAEWIVWEAAIAWRDQWHAGKLPTDRRGYDYGMHVSNAR